MPTYTPIAPVSTGEESWGDYIDSIQAGAYGIGASYAAEYRRRSKQGGDYTGSAAAREWQNWFNDKRDANTGEMTPEGKALLESSIDSPAFWGSPFAATALKVTNTLPSAAVSIAPLLLGSTGIGVAAGAALAGGQASGSITNDIQREIDNKDDDWLQNHIPQYANDRLNGVSELDARDRLSETALGNKPFIAFMATALTSGVAGPVAATARGMAGRAAVKAGTAAKQGALKTAGKEFGYGALGEGFQGGLEETLGQGARIAGGFQQDYDIPKIARAGAEEALVGGVLSGGIGGASRIGAQQAIPSTAPPPTPIQNATLPFTPGGSPTTPGPQSAMAQTLASWQQNPQHPGGVAPPMTNRLASWQAGQPAPPAPPGPTFPQQGSGLPPSMGPPTQGPPRNPTPPIYPQGQAIPVGQQGQRLEPTPQKNAGIPFVITQDMRSRLGELGYDNEAIRAMRPAEAWQLLRENGQPIPSPPPTIPTPGGVKPSVSPVGPAAPRVGPGLTAPMRGAIPLASDLAPAPEIELALGEKIRAAPIEPAATAPAAAPIPSAQPQIRTPPRVQPSVSPVQPRLPGGQPSIRQPARETRVAPAAPVAAPGVTMPPEEASGPALFEAPFKTVEEMNAEEKKALQRRYAETTKGPIIAGEHQPTLHPGNIRKIPAGIQGLRTQAKYEEELEALHQKRLEHEAKQEARTKEEVEAAITGVHKKEKRVLTGKIKAEDKEKKEVRDPAEAKKLFEKHTNKDNIKESREETIARAKKIMADVRANDIKITRVDDHTPDHMLWLAEVRSLVRGKGSATHVREFLLREFEAVTTGNFDEMRAERKSEGALKKSLRDKAAPATAAEYAATTKAAELEATAEKEGDIEAVREEAPDESDIERAEARGEGVRGEEREEADRESAEGYSTGPTPVRGAEYVGGKSAPNLQQLEEKRYRVPTKEIQVWNEYTKEYETRTVPADRATTKGVPRRKKPKWVEPAVGREAAEAELEVAMEDVEFGKDIKGGVTATRKLHPPKVELLQDIAQKRAQKAKGKPKVTPEQLAASEQAGKAKRKIIAAIEKRKKKKPLPTRLFEVEAGRKTGELVWTGTEFREEADEVVTEVKRPLTKKQAAKFKAKVNRAIKAAKLKAERETTRKQEEAAARELARNPPGAVKLNVPQVKLPAKERGKKLPEKLQALIAGPLRKTQERLAALKRPVDVEAGTPADALEQGIRAAIAGKKREANPYQYKEPELRPFTYKDIQAFGLRGSDLEGAIEAAKQERYERQKQIKKHIEARSDKWLAGFERAERAIKLGTPVSKVDLPINLTAYPKAEAIKQKTIQQRRLAARMRVDKDATEAQREAGNARGGLLSWHNLPVMIQYVKGMKRFGTKMLADYGHIKGTIATDGQPIDIYLGPNLNADTIYVIDQRDPITGEFDEHKVMAGFNSAIEAQYTHSAQVGKERTGDVVPMTIPEFQKWVFKDHSRKAVERETLKLKFDRETAIEKLSSKYRVIDEMSDAVAQAPSNNLLSVVENLNAARVESVPFGTLRNTVDDYVNSEAFSKAGGQALVDLVNRIHDTVADTPIYLVNNDIARKAGVPYETKGFYDPLKNAVVLRVFDPNLKHLTLHEIAHAGLIKATYNNPDLSGIIDFAAAEFKDALVGRNITRNFYAFKNIDEFLAEFISNPSMRNRLSKIKASKELRQQYGGVKARANKNLSLFDVIWGAIKRFFGVTNKADGDTLLDIVLGATSEIQATLQGKAPGALGTKEALTRSLLRETAIHPWTDMGGDIAFPEMQAGAITDYAKGAIDTVTDQVFNRNPMGQWRAIGLAFRGMDQIAQLAKDYGGPFAASVRAAVNAYERLRVRASEILASFDPFLKKWVEAEKLHVGQQWDDFMDYLSDETDARVRGDIPLSAQPHIDPTHLQNGWAAGKHADLATRWAKLPPDLQALRTEALNITDRVQERMALGLINNQLLAVLGARNPALAHKLYTNQTLTPAEQALIGPDLEAAIKGVKALTSYKGPYYPQMRFGNHVISGRYKIPIPSGAKQLAGNEFEFSGPNSRADAMNYAAKNNPYSAVHERWTDSAGNPVPSTTPGAVLSHTVTVQNKYVQFFDSRKEAQQRYLELQTTQPTLDLDTVGVRKFNPYEFGGGDMLAADVKNLIDVLEKNHAYQAAPAAQKAAMKQSLTEVSLRMYGPTRMQARRLPRRRVAGASKDFTNVFNQYLQSASGYLAKLEVQPDLDAAMRDMDTHVSSDGDLKMTDARQNIYNEISKRITSKEKQGPPTGWDRLANRLMGLTFTNFLGSPAYAVNNGLQVAMTGLPELAGRHGLGRAGRALLNAYRVAGVGAIIKAGAKGTYRALVVGERVNFFEDILNNGKLSAGQITMLRYLRDNGTIAPDAGLEFDKVIGTGMGDKAIDYLQAMARAMPAAVETMNRVVLGIASYDLELGKTGDHQKAMEYAQEVVNLTQGNYSRTNMPTFFHANPVASLAFQFKNYGQTMYGNIARNIEKIIHDANPGDRQEAIKALTYLAGTHILMAGALGLPTEPIRWLLMPFGIQWSEAEDAARKVAADIIGPEAAELLMRGAPRALGIDLSERVGMQNLMTFGQPQDQSEEGWKAFFGGLVGGANFGMMTEMGKGMNNVLFGDFTLGLQQLSPVKFMADSIDAYRIAMEGRKTRAGDIILEPTGFGAEAALGAFGYTPARQAEVSEQRQHFYAEKSDIEGSRNELMREYAQAAPGEQRGIMRQITAYNRGRPRGQQLTMRDLNNYKKSRRSLKRVRGFPVTKLTRDLARSMDYYNVQ